MKIILIKYDGFIKNLMNWDTLTFIS